MATQAKTVAKPSTQSSKSPKAEPAPTAAKSAAKSAPEKREASEPAKHAPAKAIATLESRLAEAMGLVHAKKNSEAIKALEALAADAGVQGHFGILHTVRTYLSALQSAPAPVPAGDDPVLHVQVLLNRKESAEALALLDKALKASPGKASLHYLKATAHAQLQDAEASAQALKKAIDLDPLYLFTYRMEDEFEAVRDTAVFVPIENL